jgi:hypothetical protein
VDLETCCSGCLSKHCNKIAIFREWKVALGAHLDSYLPQLESGISRSSRDVWPRSSVTTHRSLRILAISSPELRACRPLDEDTRWQALRQIFSPRFICCPIVQAISATPSYFAPDTGPNIAVSSSNTISIDQTCLGVLGMHARPLS